MQFTPYLNFDGNCREAFTFYEKLLGGKIKQISTFGEVPENEKMPADMRDRIIHVNLQVGEQELMGSDTVADTCEGGGYQKPQGLWVSIGVPTQEEGQRVFDGLAEGGDVRMPFEKTFWSGGFGMVVDRFGTPWMVNVIYK
ncbi:MAG: VOC family protein [Brachymonas sp.]|nr:VOC family protein [Brachymonas sp.]